MAVCLSVYLSLSVAVAVAVVVAVWLCVYHSVYVGIYAACGISAFTRRHGILIRAPKRRAGVGSMIGILFGLPVPEFGLPLALRERKHASMCIHMYASMFAE